MTYFKTKLAELEKEIKRRKNLENFEYRDIIILETQKDQLKECEEEVFEVIDKIDGSPEVRKMKQFLLKKLGISGEKV